MILKKGKKCNVNFVVPILMAVGFILILGKWYDIPGIRVPFQSLCRKLQTIRREKSIDQFHKQQLTIPQCGEECTYKRNSNLADLNFNAMGDFKSTNLWEIQPFIRKTFNCQAIITRMAMTPKEIAKSAEPPRHPPENLISEFLMEGGMRFGTSKYHNNVAKASSSIPIVSERSIEKLEVKVDQGREIGTYGRGVVLNLYETLKEHLGVKFKNKLNQKLRGVVVGSQEFWVEMLLLKLGLDSITTLEYAKIKSQHPRLHPRIPYEYAQELLANASLNGGMARGIEPIFDVGVSYSSLEHSGLGRYGDPLNPNGDLEAMAQMWCLIKPGGLFFLNVPFTPGNQGIVEWNAHRIYHWGRLLEMASNWIIIENTNPRNKFDMISKILVLQKPS